MAGNLNAAGILVVAALTVFLMLRFARKPYKFGLLLVLAGLIIACAVALIAKRISLHKCGAGVPFFQWFIPSWLQGAIGLDGYTIPSGL